MEGERQMECLPPGFRFFPTDEELVTFYLANKAMDGSFTSAAIRDVDLYKSEPWDLPCKAAMTAGSGSGDECYYFFCKRSIRYPSGARARRSTAGGYWKSTGKDKDVYCRRESGRLVGTKKTLVFHRGRAPRGEKTSWVMHEYMMLGQRSSGACSRADQGEWVICRVFMKKPPSDQRTLERDLEQRETLHGQTSPGHLFSMESDGCDSEEPAALPVLSHEPWGTINRAMNDHDSHENEDLVHHADPSLTMDRPRCTSSFWFLYDDNQLGPYCSTLHILQRSSFSASDDLPDLLEYGGYDIPQRSTLPGNELTSSREAEISPISVFSLHLDESYWNFGS